MDRQYVSPMEAKSDFDIEKVLAEFPIEQLPPKLVKFFDHRGLDVLLNGEIKVTPPREFNDPFELSPRLSQEEISPKKLREHLLSDDGFMRLWWRSKYGAMDDAQYRAYVERCVAADRQTAFEWVRHLIDIVKDVAGTWGIACFSAFSDEDMKSADAIRHWAFYAKSHTGMAIEFDGTHNFFKDWHKARLLFRVGYADNGSGRSVADLAEFDKANKETEVRLVRKWASVKSAAWETEKEWRWVFPLDDTNDFPCRRVVSGERVINLRRLWTPEDGNAKMVQRVILGSRASDKLKASVRTVLNQSHFQHVELWRAFEHPDVFGLNLERVR